MPLYDHCVGMFRKNKQAFNWVSLSARHSCLFLVDRKTPPPSPHVSKQNNRWYMFVGSTLSITIDEAIYKSGNRSSKQSINQSIEQPINQSTNQSAAKLPKLRSGLKGFDVEVHGPGPKYLVPGTLYPRYLVPGTWYKVPGTSGPCGGYFLG